MHGDSEGTGGGGRMLAMQWWPSYDDQFRALEGVHGSHCRGACLQALCFSSDFFLTKELRYSPSYSQRHSKGWTTELWWGYHQDSGAGCRYRYYVSSFLHQSRGKILKFRLLKVSCWCAQAQIYCMHAPQRLFVPEAQTLTYVENIVCTMWMYAKLCILL